MPYERAQQARIDAGLCKDCGQPRGDDGTAVRCRACAEAASLRSTARTKHIRKERLEAGLCLRCGGQRDALTVLCPTCLGKIVITIGSTEFPDGCVSSSKDSARRADNLVTMLVTTVVHISSSISPPNTSFHDQTGTPSYRSWKMAALPALTPVNRSSQESTLALTICTQGAKARSSPPI
jgi:hypothetical protein